MTISHSVDAHQLMSEKNKITAYIIVTLVVSFIYQGIMAFVIEDTYSDKFTNLVLILMYFPGLIALAFMFFFQGRIQNHRLGN